MILKHKSSLNGKSGFLSVRWEASYGHQEGGDQVDTPETEASITSSVSEVGQYNMTINPYKF